MNDAKREAEAEAKKVLPLYICVDVSVSMAGDKIKAANEIVPAIINTCRENPMVDSRARFSLITFSDEAKVLSALGKGSAMQEQVFKTESGTSYTNLFRKLHEVLEKDYQQVKADQYEYFRPTVFLITDGEPMCRASEREAAFKELTSLSFKRNPNIYVFGVGNEVKAETLKQYTSAKHGRAFLTPSGTDAAESLRTFIEMLMVSTVSSASFAADSGSGEADGFIWDPDAMEDSGLVQVDLGSLDS